MRRVRRSIGWLRRMAVTWKSWMLRRRRGARANFRPRCGFQRKQLDGFLADLRKLGHVEEESRGNEEVSAQYVDLEARLKAARATEERLIQLLGTRTGKLSDVLEAERELARVRGEIESMQGENAVLVHRVSYATVQVELSEVYRERLTTDSKGTKIRNALVEGLSNVEDGAVSLLLFALAFGPSILFWLAILLVPAWLLWRRFQRRSAGVKASHLPKNVEKPRQALINWRVLPEKRR